MNTVLASNYMLNFDYTRTMRFYVDTRNGQFTRNSFDAYILY